MTLRVLCVLCVLLAALSLDAATRHRAPIVAFMKASGYPNGRPGFVVDSSGYVPPNAPVHDLFDVSGPHAVVRTERGHADVAGRVAFADGTDDFCGKSRAECAFTNRSIAATLRLSVERIVLRGSEKQMVRVDARRVVAAVEHQQAVWDRAMRQSPRDTVRLDFRSEHATGAERSRNLSVTGWNPLAGPQPAHIGLGDVTPEVRDRVLRVFADVVALPAAEAANQRGRTHEVSAARFAQTDDGHQANSTQKTKRSAAIRAQFRRLTGHPNGWAGHVIDHEIPLCAGGQDVVSNLQWQTVEASYKKDVFERALCAAMKKQGLLIVPIVKP